MELSRSSGLQAYVHLVSDDLPNAAFWDKVTTTSGRGLAVVEGT
jgi:hypothetical protein